MKTSVQETGILLPTVHWILRDAIRCQHLKSLIAGTDLDKSHSRLFMTRSHLVYSYGDLTYWANILHRKLSNASSSELMVNCDSNGHNSEVVNGRVLCRRDGKPLLNWSVMAQFTDTYMPHPVDSLAPTIYWSYFTKELFKPILQLGIVQWNWFLVSARELYWW